MKEEFDIHKAGNTMPETEREYENALHPLSFENFSDQPEAVKNLKIFVDARAQRLGDGQGNSS